MPTLLTKDYLRGLATEAALEAAKPSQEALTAVRARLDQAVAAVDAKRASEGAIRNQLQRLETRLDNLEQAQAASKMHLADQQAEIAREVRAQLRDMRTEQSGIRRRVAHTTEMLGKVLDRFAKLERQRGK